MRIYQVGGSVRDMFLNSPVSDRDWVVIGATPDEMLALNFTKVGADFPVFLHPESGEEYALARTERKKGLGYHGFEVNVQNVTLEEDLMRRDLTINAMAMDENGKVIDPYGGQTDIHRKVLRHVSEAFEEDPLRILRVLRFWARFGPEWHIAEETERLMHEMVRKGEASQLVPERIWKETSRALMEPHPHLYLEGLERFGLTHLGCFEPYKFVSFAVPIARKAARQREAFDTRCTLVFGHSNQQRDCPQGIPLDSWKRVRAWSQFGGDGRLLDPGAYPEETLEFFEKVDLFRNKEVLETLLDCWNVLEKFTPRLRDAACRVLSVDTKAISAAMPPGPAVGLAIRRARLDAIKEIAPAGA